MINKGQTNLRNIVLTLLIETEEGKKSHLILKSTLDKYNYLDKQPRSFITRAYQGTMERRIELDYIINQVSDTPINKMNAVIRNIIRMAVYQLKYMDSVPDSALCNEAVKLAEKRGMHKLKGFVNGVIRNIIRNIDTMEYPKNFKENLSIKFSMPMWIVKMWCKHYGKNRTIKMLEDMYKEPLTTVRCNTSKASLEDIIKRLQTQDVVVEQSELYSHCLFISNYDRLDHLNAFKSGLITVQDQSSMLAGIAASPRMDDYIIDVCAAPGGKSLHMSELLGDSGTVIARDINKYKISLIEENIKRIKNKNIQCEVWNALKEDENSVEKADIVMADLPCSGLGVVGNKSDIKYNISMGQIKELVSLQRNILKVVSKYVKPGGKMIFSTCTVNHFENQENVKWIEENLPFRLSCMSNDLPKQINKDKGYVQIFPGEYGMDGFFISTFIKEQ